MDPRYFIKIKTQPHGSWFHPQGWEWASLDDARAGARRADTLWMAVRLIDSVTGEHVSFGA